MGILIGYMANRADRLVDALHQERDAIAVPSTDDPSGWGIGFYQGGEVLHKKRRLLEGRELDWQQVANGVRSDCAIIHVRQATVGDFRSENTHPFRMRSWLFAHSGTIERFDPMKERLLETMPDFIRRSIRGETDSEYFFHLVVSFLHDASQLDRPTTESGPVLSAIRSAVRLVDRLSKEVGAEPATLNFLLTDGHALYAVRRGLPMHYVCRDGIYDPVDPEREASPEPHGPRYVFVAGSAKEPGPDYRPIADAEVCVIDRDLQIEHHPL